MNGRFSASLRSFHWAPNRFEISELCILGLSDAIFRLWPLDHTMNAFIGRFTLSIFWFLLLVLLLLLFVLAPVRPECGWWWGWVCPAVGEVMCPPPDNALFVWGWGVCCWLGLSPLELWRGEELWALTCCCCCCCCKLLLLLPRFVWPPLLPPLDPLICDAIDDAWWWWWWWDDNCDCASCDCPKFIIPKGPSALYGDVLCPWRADAWWGGIVAWRIPPFMSASIVNISSEAQSLYANSLVSFNVVLVNNKIQLQLFISCFADVRLSELCWR